jgi:hypothetical protein
MPFPPPVLPINRTDATPQQTTHPADHNAISAAINDTVAWLQSPTSRFTKFAAGDRGGAWTATQHAGIQQAAVALNTSRVDWVQTAGRRYLVLASCWFSKAGADVSSQVVMQILRGDTSALIANVRSYCLATGDVTIHAQAVITSTTSVPTFVQLQALTGAGFVNANERTIQVIDIGTGDAA